MSPLLLGGDDGALDLAARREQRGGERLGWP